MKIILLVTLGISVVFARHDSGSTESDEGSQKPRPPAPKSCESGWTAFDRPHGTWCMKPFYGNTNRATAAAACDKHGASLTGFQNANERLKAAHLIRALINKKVPGAHAVTWIGGLRKARCVNVAACAPANTFEWDDGHTNGTFGFNFSANQPDFLGGTQYCLTMMVHRTSDAELIDAIYHYYSGQMNDVLCDMTQDTYICGKPAK